MGGSGARPKPGCWGGAMKVSLASPPAIGLEILLDDQVYTLVEHRPYTRKDGAETVLLVWRAACPVCGVAFEQVRHSKGWPDQRRCDEHKRPNQKVARQALRANKQPGGGVE